MKRHLKAVAIAALTAAVVAAALSLWLRVGRDVVSDRSASSSDRTVLLAASASVKESGLLDALLPGFAARRGVSVKVLPMNDEQSMTMGRHGEVDLILSHSPELEQALLKEGHALQRINVMHTFLWIVGPRNDPAGIRDTQDPARAFTSIASLSAPFVGHAARTDMWVREQAFWKNAAITPAGTWYSESESPSPSETLLLADRRRAYVLTDRATYLSVRDRIDLVPMVLNSELLEDQYHLLLIDPDKHPAVRFDEAAAFAQYLMSVPAQKIIGEHKRSQYGISLYESNLSLPPGDDPSRVPPLYIVQPKGRTEQSAPLSPPPPDGVRIKQTTPGSERRDE